MITQNTANSLEITPAGSKLVAKPKPPKRLVFTKNLLGNLPLPGDGERSYFYDAKTPGLAIAVSPKGKKVFLLYKKVARRPERITIGPYPDLTIDQARRKAEELKGAIASGENPASKRRLVAAEATLGELFSTYLEHYAKVHKKTWSNDQSMFNKHLNAWRVRKISGIPRMDIVNLHKHIGSKSGQYAANRVVELLSSMFNKAIEWGWHGENPATKIKAFKEDKRKRFLQPEEVPNFFKALGEEPDETLRDFFLLSLFTGARRANVQAMKWQHINFASASWTIPAEESKNAEDVDIALSVTALGILEKRKGSESKWVFPGNGKSGHLIEPKTAWARILKRAGIEDLRIHDLRRTLGSWQAGLGTSLPIIGRSLGHKSLQATQIYARLNLDPVRASVTAATDALLLAANGKLLGDGNA